MRSVGIAARCTVWTALVAALFATPAFAQSVGVRAQGMGEAFTGVADDASAVYWNPAGLASGAYFSGVIDFNSLGTGSSGNVHHESSGTLVSFAMPPLGLSYYRTSSETVPADRLVAHHAGATLDQSLWGGLAVGAMFEVVHGVVGDRFSSTKLDMNVGVMESGSAGRVGVVIRNLLQPTFGAPDVNARLNRQVRIGGSVNVADDTLIAADADLTKTPATPSAERRDAAIGLEQRLSEKAVVRGGVHWNTSGAPIGITPEGSIGASYAVYGRASADVQITFGSKNGDRGWGVGFRMVF